MQSGVLKVGIVVSIVLLPAARAAEPVGWRNDGTGRFDAADPPREWSAEQKQNVVWKTELPGGSLASPVVVGSRVFVKSDPAELLCLACDDGRTLWRRSHQYVDVFGPETGGRIERDLELARQLRRKADDLRRRRREADQAALAEQKRQFEQQIAALEKQIDDLTKYPQMPQGEPGNTGSTPASDGQSVFAAFGTGIVSSHTLDGRRNWMIFVEAPGSDQSASPLVLDGKLIVHLRHLVALDAATGEELWRAETPALHGSPVAALLGETPVVVTAAGAVVRLSDGRILARDQFRLGHSSPLVDDGVVYALEDGGLKALRLTAPEGDPPRLPTIWEAEGSRTNRLASPVCFEGLLYGITEQGILEVTDAETGDRVHRRRLDFGGGRADPSICLAGGLLYLSSNRGTTIVVRPGREYEELFRNSLDDEFSSSLCFAGPRLYIRTRHFLYCIGR